MKPFLLDSPRLILRPFTGADVAAFAAYRSEPEIARYQSWEAPFPLEKAARFVAEMQSLEPGVPGEWYQLALEHKAGGELIGDLAFLRQEDDPRLAEIGFTLAPAFHGQGYASEAVRRLLAYLFDELDVHRVCANCDPRNSASARVLQRVGMRHEGRWIDSLWFKGGWVSEDWYAILQREWRALAER